VSFGHLVLLFVFMPAAELMLLFRVDDFLGWERTIALIVITGVVGAYMAKRQGVAIVRRIQSELAAGRLPAPRMIDGVMILVAGALLITPGLITDAVGFLLLLPPVRAAIRRWLRERLERKLRDGTAQVSIWRL
jgi:UPF0716 protein FxsA